MFWRKKQSSPDAPAEVPPAPAAAETAATPAAPETAAAPPVAPAQPAPTAVPAPTVAPAVAPVIPPAVEGAPATQPIAAAGAPIQPPGGSRVRLGLGGLRVPGRAVSPVKAIVVGFLVLTLVAMVSVLGLGQSSGGGASGTPEQTLNSWAAAVERGDYTAADSYLSDHLIAGGTNSRYLGSKLGLGLDLGTNYSEPTLVVQNVSNQGDRATVQIAIKFNSYGMDMSFPGTATLVKEDGAWKIDSINISY